MEGVPDSVRAASLHGVHGAHWQAVEPGRALHWPTPVCAAGEPVDLLRWLAPAHPDLGVLTVPGGTVHGRAGWVWTADDLLVEDVSWHFDRVSQADAAARLHTHPTVTLPGRVLSLLTDWGGENHAHLLYDSLPRLDLFERAGGATTDVDTVLVHERAVTSGWCDELGLPRERCMIAEPDVRYRCGELLAVSFPGTSKALMPWAAEFLRVRLPARPPRTGRRRLYVPRTTTRLMRNEAQIADVLAPFGIEAIDPESAPHREVRSWFADAELIVGPHGAGLADLVHCRPGAVVLELIPTDHPFPYWYAAAQAVQADHRYLACPSTGDRSDDDAGPSVHDAWCDVALLRTALDRIVLDLAARRQ